MRSALLVPLLVLSTAIAGCNLPKDPEGTSQAVEGGVLRVGALTPELGEEDRAAIEAAASAFDAEAEIVEGAAHDLVARLEKGELQIVIGDLPVNTPFSSKVGLSRAFGTVTVGGKNEDRVLAVMKGENGFLTRIEKALPEKRGQ